VLPSKDMCKKCGQSKAGHSHQFYYGTKTGQTSSRFVNTTTTTTTYKVLGDRWVHICNDCMRKMILRRGLGGLSLGILLGIYGAFGIDLGMDFGVLLMLLCWLIALIVMISNIVFLLKRGNENYKQHIAINLTKKEIMQSTMADTFWTTKQYGNLKIRTT
jgi:hypothetical protein